MEELKKLRDTIYEDLGEDKGKAVITYLSLAFDKAMGQKYEELLMILHKAYPDGKTKEQFKKLGVHNYTIKGCLKNNLIRTEKNLFILDTEGNKYLQQMKLIRNQQSSQKSLKSKIFYYFILPLIIGVLLVFLAFVLNSTNDSEFIR